ncbi:hypothetical protein TcasGA2_TC005778 [Tribolium castaneum]|uniref:Secreted protein n=1 Tax=Tribolium castaneum TaxID=7070 RepID=D6WWB1_TRICA|nr:hypothetical protein TcasGA2_TC005778 [Tribolium castaneum]
MAKFVRILFLAFFILLGKFTKHCASDFTSYFRSTQHTGLPELECCSLRLSSEPSANLRRENTPASVRQTKTACDVRRPAFARFRVKLYCFPLCFLSVYWTFRSPVTMYYPNRKTRRFFAQVYCKFRPRFAQTAPESGHLATATVKCRAPFGNKTVQKRRELARNG